MDTAYWLGVYGGDSLPGVSVRSTPGLLMENLPGSREFVSRHMVAVVFVWCCDQLSPAMWLCL